MAQSVAGPALRWAVVIVDLDPTEGHEQAGSRRALVVSYEAFHRSGLLTVCPITAGRERPRYPGEVALPAGEGGQTKDGLVLCAQVRTISVRRIRASGTLPDGGIAYVADPRIRSAVRGALRHHLGLDTPRSRTGPPRGSWASFGRFVTVVTAAVTNRPASGGDDGAPPPGTRRPQRAKRVGFRELRRIEHEIVSRSSSPKWRVTR